MNLMDIYIWTVLLVIAAITEATVLAYLYKPRWKALILMMPMPFVFATLAVGRRVDITNVAGLLLLISFYHAVRFLHYNLKVPIVISIILSRGL